MLQADQKAEEAMQNITMTSIVRLANSGLDKIMDFTPSSNKEKPAKK